MSNTTSSRTRTTPTNLIVEVGCQKTDHPHFVDVGAELRLNGDYTIFTAPRMPISLLTCHDRADVHRYIEKHVDVDAALPVVLRILESIVLEALREYVGRNGSDNTRGAFLGS